MFNPLRSLGAVPTGARAERVRTSPNYRDGQFRNRAAADSPAAVPGAGRPSSAEALREWRERGAQRPAKPVPLVRERPATEPGDLRLTWLGHASTLVELDGAAVLLDPIWSDRCSPVAGVGPRRLHAVPMEIAALPELAAILISHDHYDHLDMRTIRRLTAAQSAPFVVPLGVGAHLERWGVPADRIVELDWDEEHAAGGLRLVATPAQHFSGRTLTRNRTLWSGWAVIGERRRVFYTGDTGYFPGFADIGAAYGPFDATLMQIGAYGDSWPDIHMTPEEAVAAHRDVRGELLIPVHWGTFTLAFHAWSEPIDRLLAAAEHEQVAVAVPRPGEAVDITAPVALDHWWQRVARAPEPAAVPLHELVQGARAD
ncbi:MBL fold metallo-hydrolase [Pilimelia anulata]|nr:MBL fold metallo-hydrolase [Pilimelia anulata]